MGNPVYCPVLKRKVGTETCEERKRMATSINYTLDTNNFRVCLSCNISNTTPTIKQTDPLPKYKITKQELAAELNSRNSKRRVLKLSDIKEEDFHEDDYPTNDNDMFVEEFNAIPDGCDSDIDEAIETAKVNEEFSSKDKRDTPEGKRWCDGCSSWKDLNINNFKQVGKNRTFMKICLDCVNKKSATTRALNKNSKVVHVPVEQTNNIPIPKKGIHVDDYLKEFFKDYPEVLEQIESIAQDEMRTVKNQIIYMLKDSLKIRTPKL